MERPLVGFGFWVGVGIQDGVVLEIGGSLGGRQVGPVFCLAFRSYLLLECENGWVGCCSLAELYWIYGSKFFMICSGGIHLFDRFAHMSRPKFCHSVNILFGVQEPLLSEVFDKKNL